MRARTIVRRALLWSFAIAAVLTVIACLRLGTGITGVKLVITSWSTCFASTLISLSLAGWDMPGGRAWARAGVGATLVAVAGILIGLWWEIDGDTFWWGVATLTVVGVGGAHGALLSLARVAPRYQTMRVLASANLAVLVTLICYELYFDDKSGAVWATIGSLALLDLVFSLALFVLDHVRRTTLVDPEAVALPTAIARERD